MTPRLVIIETHKEFTCYLHLTQTAEADARSTIETLFQRQPEPIQCTTVADSQRNNNPKQLAEQPQVPPAKSPRRR